ncbi:hypothetical protein K0M31_010240 [Melipona bicolor]|uniref:Uncharacterized protein n=1 Tax=Melipona bicolor TaxID=60889 RepID=A0AA40FMF0_9HYME|nr:hypothetical protein K0M31_010240 [Melipona bicolor]
MCLYALPLFIATKLEYTVMQQRGFLGSLANGPSFCGGVQWLKTTNLGQRCEEKKDPFAIQVTVFQELQHYLRIFYGNGEAHLLQILIVFGILAVGLSSPVPGHSSHKHVRIHVPYHVHTVHHHHVKKVPVHHVEKVHVPVPIPIHHVEKVPVPVPVHHVEKVHVPVPVIEKVPVPVKIHEEKEWW